MSVLWVAMASFRGYTPRPNKGCTLDIPSVNTERVDTLALVVRPEAADPDRSSAGIKSVIFQDRWRWQTPGSVLGLLGYYSLATGAIRVIGVAQRGSTVDVWC